MPRAIPTQTAARPSRLLNLEKTAVTLSACARLVRTVMPTPPRVPAMTARPLAECLPARRRWILAAPGGALDVTARPPLQVAPFWKEVPRPLRRAVGPRRTEERQSCGDLAAGRQPSRLAPLASPPTRAQMETGERGMVPEILHFRRVDQAGPCSIAHALISLRPRKRPRRRLPSVQAPSASAPRICRALHD